MLLISSRSNDKIKLARSLQQGKSRRETGLHFIEGDKLVLEAIASGAELVCLFVLEGSPLPTHACEGYYVTASVMEALCAGTPQRLCATVRTPSTTPPKQYSGLVVVLDRLQDPGNVGTVLRSADALGAGCLLLSPDCADPFGPKTLRSSMGSAYHLPVYIGDVESELIRLKQQGYLCLCGHLKGKELLPSSPAPKALIIGNEGQGVSKAVAEQCYLYRLPMKGRAESLNAAVFASLMLYELSR